MITLPVILESIRSLKDKSYKLTFETSELTPEQFTGIGQNLQNFGWLAFKKAAFGEKDKAMIDSLKVDYEDGRKSQSQRLRNVLYRVWENNPEGYKDHNLHYKYYMDQLINHFKAKLP